ncbi:MAG: hypothetical protein NTY19_24445 [Planctomycetota bacterium]|nr:hypothetical protein [Planctomycetota bacterium]
MTPSTTKSRLDRRRQPASQHRRRYRRLQLESLEDRRLLAADSLLLHYDALGNVDLTSEASGPISSLENAALGDLPNVAAGDILRPPPDTDANDVGRLDVTGEPSVVICSVSPQSADSFGGGSYRDVFDDAWTWDELWIWDAGPDIRDVVSGDWRYSDLRIRPETTSSSAFPPLTPTVSPEYLDEGVVFQPYLTVSFGTIPDADLPWSTDAETAVVPARWSAEPSDVVSAASDGGPIVRVRLQAADLSGNPITRIETGSPFLLQAYVQSLQGRQGAALSEIGVFAAYLDVTYDADLVATTARSRDDVTFVGDYQNGRTGAFSTPGLLDEVGAFGGMAPRGTTERLLWSIPMQARQAGLATWTPQQATAIGHELLVYGLDFAIPPKQVDYVSATLTIDGSSDSKDSDPPVNIACQDAKAQPEDNSLAPVLRGEGWGEGPNGKYRSSLSAFAQFGQIEHAPQALPATWTAAAKVSPAPTESLKLFAFDVPKLSLHDELLAEL